MVFPSSTIPPTFHTHIYFSADLISRKAGEARELAKEVLFLKIAVGFG
jgi:hypothetical protein